jgi:hypothetical protein
MRSLDQALNFSFQLPYNGGDTITHLNISMQDITPNATALNRTVVSSWWVEYSLTNPNVNMKNATAGRLQLTGLTNGVRYNVRVAAVNSVGNSFLSAGLIEIPSSKCVYYDIHSLTFSCRHSTSTQ